MGPRLIVLPVIAYLRVERVGAVILHVRERCSAREPRACFKSTMATTGNALASDKVNSSIGLRGANHGDTSD